MDMLMGSVLDLTIQVLESGSWENDEEQSTCRVTLTGEVCRLLEMEPVRTQ